MALPAGFTEQYRRVCDEESRAAKALELCRKEHDRLEQVYRTASSRRIALEATVPAFRPPERLLNGGELPP